MNYCTETATTSHQADEGTTNWSNEPTSLWIQGRSLLNRRDQPKQEQTLQPCPQRKQDAPGREYPVGLVLYKLTRPTELPHWRKLTRFYSRVKTQAKIPWKQSKLKSYSQEAALHPTCICDCALNVTQLQGTKQHTTTDEHPKNMQTHLPDKQESTRWKNTQKQ